MIKIRNLTKHFGNNTVLDSIDLDISQGDVVGIIGPSGTGKSTLLRCIDLLETPDKGTIEIDGFKMDLAEHDRKKMLELRRSTSMVFQKFNLFERKTALENVMEGLVTVQKKSKDEAEKIALQELERVGMLDRSGHYPKHISGGQQQRVAIARAIAMQPKLMLLDEPTSALDPELVGEVFETVRAIAKQGFTMMLVSHEMNFVRNVANRVIFLDGGKIVEDGTPKEVFENPKSRRAKEFFSKMQMLDQPEYVI